MFYFKIGEHYLDLLTKKICVLDDVLSKNRFNSKLDQIKVLNGLREKNSQKKLNIAFTVTTECNLKCAYCFENSVVREAINDDDMKTTIEAIKKYIKNNGINLFSLTIFGGEPFFEKRKILLLTKELYEFCNCTDVKFELSMVTNGLIFDESFINQLKKRNLRHIQLTFDGDEKINNSRRISRYESNVNVYRTILNNINKFADVIENVNIKYNLDIVNKSAISVFLDDLVHAVKAEYHHKICLIVEAIQKTTTANAEFDYENTDVELANAYLYAIGEIMARGFKYRTKVFNTPCMATAYNSFLIDTKGGCSACISNFEKNDLYMGPFKDMDINISKAVRTKLTRTELLADNCTECKFLICCFGGCHYELLAHNKKILENLNCRKIFFMTFIAGFYREFFLKKGVNTIE